MSNQWLTTLGYSAFGARMLRKKDALITSSIKLGISRRNVGSRADLRAARTRRDAAARAVPVSTARPAGGLRVVAHGSARGERRTSAAAHRHRGRGHAARRAGARRLDQPAVAARGAHRGPDQVRAKAVHRTG